MSGSLPKVELDEVILAPLRAMCLPYPEAVEAEAFGSPTFQVRTKNFAMVHKPDERVSVWCKAPPGAQEAYLASEPDRYYRPPYLGPAGWIAAWLSPECQPDWDEIAAIIDESYRLVAPKRLAALLDDERGR
ncbi:MAG: MmcQ/YjbR family DNA-binding protein [Chloroflexota bacterium]|nr:MmcQ/YjbR family DNA-binding protein [Chloroflexota bacterium]